MAMVVIGGMTRLTHSGLSITDWSFIGSVPPLTEEDWQEEFRQYQQFPEYKELHYHFTLEDFKGIFWWEFIHRALGRFIGVVFLVPFIFFWARGWFDKKLLGKLTIILSLGFLQALLGWFMVKSGLVDVPRVSHYRLAAHLITAFITCAYIYWVMLGLRPDEQAKTSLEIHRHAGVLLFLVILQIIYGAFVAGLRAGYIHNTWPLMDGQLVAASVTALSPVWTNFLEGQSGVQFIHRTLPVLIVIYAVYLWFSKKPQLLRPRKALNLVLVFLGAQFCLGVFTLLYAVPVWLGVLHQVTALALLLSVVRLYYYSGSKGKHSG